MLTETQKQFIFKRSLFQKVSGYTAWSVGVSSAVAWGLMYWLKPEMVNPQAVLSLLKAKKRQWYRYEPIHRYCRFGCDRCIGGRFQQCSFCLFY